MFLRRCVSAALVMAFVYLPCRAGIVPVKPAQPTAAAEAAARDVVLTIQARRLLLKDRELATLNVGVRVRNRVAVLWGPVPSVELALKAESCVREMFEIVEIRNELFVGGDDLTRAKSSIPSLPPADTRPELPQLSLQSVPGLPAALPARPQRKAVPPAEDEPEPRPMRLPKRSD